MGTFTVKVLYDFQGESNTAEMSIVAGETLTVTRTDVGEGWWEGVNSRNQSGLFPEAYVEKASSSSHPPNIPAPVLPPQNDWGDAQQNKEDWDDDDDWDDDTVYSEIGNNHGQSQSIYSNEQNQNQISHQFDNMSLGNLSTAGDNKGTITKKSLNIFSSYVKSGLEGYILGNSASLPVGNKKFTIFRDSDDVLGRWEIMSNPYTVQIASPKKASKMGGLKSFIAYQLTPSFSNVEVSRRYKHFDWLHDRLTAKFNVIAIPPLPDKQVSGRYEEQFIEHRRAQLQEFINYMCRHPVLSTCDVWVHFLTCTDEKQWKLGKRNAEKDQMVGANFCLSIEAPEKDILPSLSEPKIEENLNYIIKLDQCIKNLMNTAQDQQKKCVNMYKREFMRIGECFFALGSSFEYNQQGMYSKASVDVKNIGTTYMAIGKLYGEQAKIDWQPLFDKLYIYKGITSDLPDILNLQKLSEQKKKDCERNSQNPQTAIADIRRRADVLTYTVFSELNHFQNERDTDLRLTMKTFLQEQLNFYKNVVLKLEETLDKFD
ncbi:sorting nexin lst-4 [Diabrotica virgifera virgifera]|uniref:Sorting nexin lst-4 n=1 Tax=Diabrotica virgifera virgifera TaxID=50390 RepID=A0ABM5JUT5_DIAVI|nr:sorting nexin lst-4 [Diabrotica virgifera virgifera]XP_050501704.1 sorting nexin lst-4 [Diabrotica virgifera virgifera]